MTDFEEDDAKLMRVLERWQNGATKHRRIMAEEEDAVLSMASHYRTRCFELANQIHQQGLESMALRPERKKS